MQSSRPGANRVGEPVTLLNYDLPVQVRGDGPEVLVARISLASLQPQAVGCHCGAIALVSLDDASAHLLSRCPINGPALSRRVTALVVARQPLYRVAGGDDAVVQATSIRRHLYHGGVAVVEMRWVLRRIRFGAPKAHRGRDRRPSTPGGAGRQR